MAGQGRLDELLTQSASRVPHSVAVVDPNAGEISYSDLLAAADAIAASLVATGIEPGDRVAICAPKSISTVAAILGVLRAGGAYVPVDATAPLDRNSYIFNDCAVRAIVTTPALSGRLKTGLDPEASISRDLTLHDVPGEQLVLAGGAKASERPPSASSVPSGLAYILYTSGSTGKPKGVMHSHSTGLSFVDWCSEELRPTEQDRFSSHAPFHFDLSILDLYVSLKHGAALVLIGEERGKQPLQLAQLVSEQRISIWYSTPSILRLLVEYGKMERFSYADLRIVCYAGEVFPPKHQRALRARWPHPRYYNLYGPTETNVCTFDRVHEPPPDDHQAPLPIGWVCSGNRARVADPNGRRTTVGEEGELLISGDSVMLGYWNLPEQDSRAFLEDEDGSRWYRTGDMVIDKGGGYYYLLGRRDRMVKRRGYRVELAEIEAALHRHENITEAGAMAFPDPESGVSIKAFINWTGEKLPSVVALKTFAAAHLPSYMIPDHFVVLPHLPKTSTDKIDYQKLKESR